MDQSFQALINAPIVSFEVDEFLKSVQDTIQEDGLGFVIENGLDDLIAPLQVDELSYTQSLYNIPKVATHTYEEDGDVSENSEILLESSMEKGMEFLWYPPSSVIEGDDHSSDQNSGVSSYQSASKRVNESEEEVVEAKLHSDSTIKLEDNSQESRSTEESKDTRSEDLQN